MHPPPKLWLLAGVVLGALALVGVGTGSAGQASAKAKGTVVFGADQEPGILNTNIIGGDPFWGSQVTSPVFTSTFRVQPDFSFRPEVISKATITKSPFSVTYYIKKNAHWNDGKPITAQDYEFTRKTVMDPNVKILSTIGFEDISKTKIINSKTVKFTFKKPFAGWRTLFSGQPLLLPSHALQGEDFNKVWLNDLNNPKTGKPISSGPFYMPNGGWQRGRQLTLLANPKYWGPKAKLSRVVYRFLPDTNATAEQIRGGEVDVIYPQPQLFLVPLRHQRGLKTQIGRGPIFEHIDFQEGFKGKGNPLLKNLWMRQAIGYGIDRAAIVKALYTTTDIAPGLPVMNDVFITTQSPYYKPHWKYLTRNTAKARQLLASHGCTRGGDGIYSCGGRRASFGFVWRSGNQLRQLTFEAMQAQLKQVGIEIKADDSPNALSQRLPNGDFDIILYAWVGNPDISGLDSIYGCRNDATNEAQQNNQGYCNRTADKLLKRANRIFNIKQQAAVSNRAFALIAKDLATIPLFQKPTYLIYKSKIKGVKENPTSEGPVWNIGKWTA
jgi:peptide/nickel transport system substrate-binding protein